MKTFRVVCPPRDQYILWWIKWKDWTSRWLLRSFQKCGSLTLIDVKLQQPEECLEEEKNKKNRLCSWYRSKSFQWTFKLSKISNLSWQLRQVWSVATSSITLCISCHFVVSYSRALTVPTVPCCLLLLLDLALPLPGASFSFPTSQH